MMIFKELDIVMDMGDIISIICFTIYQMFMLWQSAPQSLTQMLLRRV